MKRLLLVLFAAILVCASPRPAPADGTPGDFDFFVFVLSWSPTYCAIGGNPNSPQCGGDPYGFIVHGLWPQYESGYPEYCRSSMDQWVPGSVIDSMRDIMPSGGLIGSQWRKHGLCSGLPLHDYFDLIRQAYENISIPEDFAEAYRDRSVSPGSVESAFVKANRGLTSGGISVACRQGEFYEVRLCLTKDLEFRECSEVDRGGCRASRINVPAIQ